MHAHKRTMKKNTKKQQKFHKIGHKKLFLSFIVPQKTNGYGEKKVNLNSNF